MKIIAAIAVAATLACTGTPGPQGAAGPAGSTGPQGTPGPQGVPGPTGPMGAPGEMGASGPTGATGAAGMDGAPGAIGPTGPAGLMGSPGPTGPTGPAGADAFAPPGTIVAFAGTTAPTGWLMCDGAAVSRTTYANLFSVITIAWGGGDGVTTFNLPDLRGRFLRGVDNGAGRDPDRATRTASNTGGNTGDAVGTVEPDQFQGHGHDYEAPTNSSYAPGTPYGSLGNGSNQRTHNRIQTPETLAPYGTARFGSETRPVNAGVNYIIKY